MKLHYSDNFIGFLAKIYWGERSLRVDFFTNLAKRAAFSE